MTRPIHEIAKEIHENWKHVNYAALPYLNAMDTLTDITDHYRCNAAGSIIIYFLANATTWRGDVARRIKLELNAIYKNEPPRKHNNVRELHGNR